jgi:HEAT repeat protein
MNRALLLLFLVGCSDPTVKEPYQQKDLTVEEIRAKLKSEDFKHRLEASKQIDKLPSEEKLLVLLNLAADPEPSTRLLAVKKLQAVDDPRARQKLEQLAQSDPDTDVREAAGQR